MMNRKALVLLLPVLTGCSKTVTNYLYQVQYGYCVDLYDSAFSYDSIPVQESNVKEVQTDFSFDYDDTLYVHYDLILNEDDLNTHLVKYGFLYSKDEINQNFTLGTDTIFVFQMQVPKGYHAYRRMNVQQDTPSGNQILVTPGFYYYSNRTSISYVFVDMIEDENKTEPSVYTAIYHVTEEFASNLRNTGFRFILSNQKKGRKDLWVPEDYEDKDVIESEPEE